MRKFESSQKAEPNRLIPPKPTENLLELLIVKNEELAKLLSDRSSLISFSQTAL